MKDFPDIKQVRDGVAYNTRTSTLLGNGEPAEPTRADGRPAAAVEQLYRTRAGRYFIAHRAVPHGTATVPKGVDEIEPLSKEQAIEWLTTYQPESQELFLMNLKFVKPPTSEGTPLSVRIDSNLKEGIALRADLRGCPASALHALYLRHGFANDIDRPLLPPSVYKTEDGVQLLDGDGEAAYNGIPDNGDNSFEIYRAEVAAAFRTGARTIPANLRSILRAAIEGPDEKVDESSAVRTQMREALLSDIARWLKLMDERPTWG
jgi:hypothetical protein